MSRWERTMRIDIPTDAPIVGHFVFLDVDQLEAFADVVDAAICALRAQDIDYIRECEQEEEWQRWVEEMEERTREEHESDRID